MSFAITNDQHIHNFYHTITCDKVLCKNDCDLPSSLMVTIAHTCIYFIFMLSCILFILISQNFQLLLKLKF
jgi:hypothetical protein